MSKWKARLEVWNKGEKVTSRWIEILFWFLQGDITHLLDFAYLWYQYASYYNKAKAIEWENLKTEMWAEHIAFLWKIWNITKKVIKSLNT